MKSKREVTILYSMPKTIQTIKTTPKKDGPVANILGVAVSSTSEGEVLKLVRGWIREKKGKRLIFTPNSEMLVAADEDSSFKEILNRADINIPDGMGLVLASRGKIKSRVTGIDVMAGLMGMAAKEGLRVFLLGGEGDEAKEAAKKFSSIKDQFSNKFEIEADAGPKRILEASQPEKEALIKKINKFRPDLLFVAFGHGKQERWLVENLDSLNIKVGMGVGGAFNYLAGRTQRPPRWVGEMGMEWLWRLVQEPWRWRRQMKLFRFWWLVLAEKW